jgi:hypothetical protein
MKDSGRIGGKAAPTLWRAAAIILIISGLLRPISAQQFDYFDPASAELNGLHLYRLSVSSMSANGLGVGNEFGLPFSAQLSGNRSVTTMQASAAFGLLRSIGKSSLNINYTPYYVRGLRGTNFDSINHALAIAMGKGFGTKWAFSGSINGVMSDFDQLLFAGSRATGIATTPATFDDLAAAILTGRSVNSALTQVVNASPTLASPELAYAYGGRILSVSANASVSYAYSTRSNVTLSVTTARAQLYSRGNNQIDRGSNGTLSIPWTTNAVASFNWGYSLSPRTTIGVNVSTNRTLSRFQDAYASQAGVSIGRTMSNRWFLQGMVGTGWISRSVKPCRLTKSPR